MWLAAAWYLTNQKQGVSALGLQRVLGLGSHQIAWTRLHRFRRAMVCPDRDRLKGPGEVGETYLAITDLEEPISPVGRKNKTSKVLVVLAVELLQPKGFGRIRLRRIENDSDECVVPFVQACIEPGAQVRPDGSAAYCSLSGLGYDHQRTVMLGSDVPAHVSMVGVHRVASLVKRWILGTHHGSVQPGFGRLPGRVRVPLQPPHVGLARHAVLQAAAAGRRHRTGDLRQRRQATTCTVPDDCIDFRRYPFFMAREVMRELIEQFKAQARGGK